MRRLAVVAIGCVVAAAMCSSADAAPAQRGRGHAKHKAARTAEYREIMLPAGTPLPLVLRTSVASDTSRVEDPVRATVREPVAVDGQIVLPVGTEVAGVVTDVAQSGRVKGRARVAMQFSRLTRDGDRYEFQSQTIEREANGTKAKDAATIGLGTGAGAALGAILDGASGATRGAVIGGAAGTGAVLATRGEEVRLEPGEALDTQLTGPLSVRVRIQ